MPSIQSFIFKALLKRLNLFGGDTLDPLKLRARIEKTAGMLKAGRNVKIVPVRAGSVAAEWVVPKGAPEDRILMYMHGGAWFMGSPRTHRSLVSRIARAGCVRALSLDYRLAPEHPFPAALDDCVEAYEWLLLKGIKPEDIVVAGDSAGGNLALALLVALRERDRPFPAGVIALSPVTDLAFTGDSIITRAPMDPFFYNARAASIAGAYILNNDPHNPLISPLYADLRGLPPVLLHAGDHEILLDDAVRFGEKAKAAGVEVETVVWPGMFHVFQAFAPYLPEAGKAIDQIGSFIKKQLDKKV